MKTPPAPLNPTSLGALNSEDRAALEDLYIRGTPENTLRAYERDLIYITAWKDLSFGETLNWPEREEVGLRFILDHSRDLGVEQSAARQTAETLIEKGLRKTFDCPAPSTLDRRIASWRVFHRMRNLQSPFEAPLVRQARSKARKAAARPPAPKSAHPITRDILEKLLEVSGSGLRGLRDRAVLLVGFASGGRRRSEIVSLLREDIDLTNFETTGVVVLQLLSTKTTQKGETPKLVLKGRAARGLVAYLDAGEIKEGPVFRRITRSGKLGRKQLSSAAISQIIKRLLIEAGFDPSFASPHGLRSGFLTQAALDGAPIQAAMRLSRHRSVAQAQQYYDDVEISENPATDLLG